MSWIKDRLDERDAARKQSALMYQQSEQTYEDLWKEVSERVREAKNNGLSVETNGSPSERKVLTGAPTNRPYTEPKELKIVLDKDKNIIAITSPAGNTEISLYVDDDWVVRLKHGGKRVTSEQAARIILEPFLFPPDAPLF